MSISDGFNFALGVMAAALSVLACLSLVVAIGAGVVALIKS